MVLFTLALTWLAVGVGLVAKSPDGAGAFAYPLLFLPFVSSAFVPCRHARPGEVVRRPARPAITNAAQHLYAFAQPLGHDLWAALGWCVSLLVV